MLVWYRNKSSQIRNSISGLLNILLVPLCRMRCEITYLLTNGLAIVDDALHVISYRTFHNFLDFR